MLKFFIFILSFKNESLVSYFIRISFHYISLSIPLHVLILQSSSKREKSSNFPWWFRWIEELLKSFFFGRSKSSEYIIIILSKTLIFRTTNNRDIFPFSLQFQESKISWYFLLFPAWALILATFMYISNFREFKCLFEFIFLYRIVDSIRSMHRRSKE